MLLAVLVLILVPASLQCSDGYYQVGGNCRKCSPSCDGGRVMVRGCTSTSDITCQCPLGKFWENAIVFCKQCSMCRRGEITVVNCTHAHDRQCVKCNPGTFAATPTRCEPCKHCGKGEITEQKCNTSHNTVCEMANVHAHLSDSPTKRTATVLIYQAISTPTPKVIKEKQPVNRVLMISCIVLAVSFCISLACVLQCFFTFKKRAGHTITKRVSIDTNSENDTICNKEVHVPLVKHDPGYLMRDVGADVIFRLGCLLNPDNLNNWLKVASNLQFTQQEINYFRMNREMAFQRLMESWVTRRGATVFKLYQIFLKIERDDCASILEDILVKESV